ncbi:MAG: protein kinase [Vicinamibacterales bacterium]
MALEPGHRLGPYEIRALLGVGGMGEVYRGRDTRLGRDVALKVISPALVEHQSSRQRFEREARAASALNHPAIVTVYDVGESDGVSWIAMEWVDGRTLRQLLADRHLPVHTAWSIGRQIGDGLAAAHARGVVHRDLKPENIMIAENGRIRILDFGLARQSVPGGFDNSLAAAETLADVGATVDGLILGTIGYMSPEQASGSPADFRSDQFALGLVIYEMLAGRRAFALPSAVETLFATIHQEPAALNSIRADVPGALDLVIRRCLAKKPDGRFASTHDLVTALEAAGNGLTNVPAPTLLVPVQKPEDQRAPASWRTRAPAVAASMIGLALVVALALFIIRQGLSSSSSDAATTRGPITSLAVLPFKTEGTDADSSYLGDELTESLINQMTRVPALTVMARATVAEFKGSRSARDVGTDLKVGAVLTGNVSRRGDQLTVQAELVETGTGARLWGETYRRPFTDLLGVQDALATEIAEQLRLPLSGEEKRALGGQGTNNPEAYELFLRARHLLISDSEEDDSEARRLFALATEKDSTFEDAHLGVASTYIRAATNGYAPPGEMWRQASAQLEKVRRLDPSNVGLRVMLAGRHFLFDWDWATAEREFRELSGEPGVLQGTRYHPVTMFFWARGWVDEAVALMERALKVDPGNLESRIMQGDFLAHAGRLKDAINYYQTISAVVPTDPRPLFGLAEVLKRTGDIDGAVSTLQKAYELQGEDAGREALAGARTEADYDRAQVAVARARRADLEELKKERYISPLDLARVAAQVGDRDQAFRYLEAAFAERSQMLVLLKVDPAWELIRTDPRFASLVRRVGIP